MKDIYYTYIIDSFKSLQQKLQIWREKLQFFRYFINGRYSNRGEANLSTVGETRTLGELKISTQSIFNDRIIPLTEYSRGNSISFELYQNELGTDLEIYSIALTAVKKYKIRNQYI